MVIDKQEHDGCPKNPVRTVRQKFYSDLLARTLAASNNAAITAELEEFQVVDPSDSLLLNLFNLFGGQNAQNVPTVPNDNGGSDTDHHSLFLTPMIRNLYSPERNPLREGNESGSEVTKSPKTTAQCVVENNHYLKTITKMLSKMDAKVSKHDEVITNNTLRLDHFDHFEKFMDKSVSELKNRMTANDEERYEIKTLV